MEPLLIIGIPLLLIFGWAIATYNILVRLRQHCRESWSGIDTELRRRYDLIPNLVEVVKGYAAHEREVFQAVTEARTRAQSAGGSPAEQAQAENVLVDGIKQLFAVSESYPDLKASEQFLKLQNELSNTEDRIQAARRFYNANVRDINTRIEVFPSNLIAGVFTFQREDFFEIEAACVRTAPTVAI
ncbi:MAG: LemA family protein [Phycisphaerales bacterium]|jgi:LemA protein|nr:LemA family protein [Phycisphaerales bacterium]